MAPSRRLSELSSETLAVPAVEDQASLSDRHRSDCLLSDVLVSQESPDGINEDSITTLHEPISFPSGEMMTTDPALAQMRDLVDAAQMSRKRRKMGRGNYQDIIATATTAMQRAGEIMSEEPDRAHAIRRDEEGRVERDGCRGSGGRGAPPDTSAGEVASDAGATAVPPERVIRRLHVSEAKSEHLARDDCGHVKGRAAEPGQNIRQPTSIEEAVAQAAWRKPDRSHDPRMRRESHEFQPKYFTERQGREKSSLMKLARRVQVQTERHDRLTRLDHAEWFRAVVVPLAEASPAGAQNYIRKHEITKLPEGVRVLFLGNAGEAVLEIMQRTGCHIQIIPSRADSGVDLAGLMLHERAVLSIHRGFSELSLFGTPAENAAALALLPDMVEMVRTDGMDASKNMRDYEVRMEAVRHAAPPDTSTPDAHSQVSAENGDSGEEEPQRIRGYFFPEKPNINKVIQPATGDAADEKTTFRRPKRLTCLTLTSYLTDLTAVTAPLISRSHAGPHEPGIAQTDSLRQHIVNEILAIFSEPATSPMISSEAVNIALNLFVRHSDFAALRSLFNILEKLPEYSITAENYDIPLAAAASNDDVGNFRFLLRTMLQHNIQPSGRTWLSLYRLVNRRFPKTRIPKLVLRLMRAKGMLQDIRYTQEVVNTGLKQSFSSFLDSKGADAKIEEFVCRVDRRYAMPPGFEPRSTQHITAKTPRPWLSKTAANIMANVLLDRGRTADALRVLQLLEDAGQYVGIDTLNTFLSAAKRARDPSFAVAVLRHFEPALVNGGRLGVWLDQRSYSILFQIAWQKRCLNMLRVIWRYACCAGQVNHAMAARVHDSLIAYLPPNRSKQTRAENAQRVRDVMENVRGGERRRLKVLKQTSRELEREGSRKGEMFFALAGKFVVGVSSHVKEAREPLPDEMEDFDMDVFGRAVEALIDGPGTLPADEFRLSEDHTGPLSGTDGTIVADQTPQLESSVTGIEWPLELHEKEILELACQPRTIVSSSEDADQEAIARQDQTAHHTRYHSLTSSWERDKQAPTSYRPYVPIADLLDKAWQKDMRWYERGLGSGGRARHGRLARARLLGGDLGDQEKAKLWKGLLREVMEHGVRVPVIVGDGVR